MKKVSLAVLLSSVFMGGCTTINPGHVGIMVNKYGSNRGVADYTTTTGFVTYNPISTSVVEYPTFVQTVKWTKNPHEGGLNDQGGPEDESITFTTKESVAVNADISLSFQLDPNTIPAFYVKFRSDDIANFAYGFLHNVTRDALMEVGGHYTVEQIMGDDEEFLHAVRDRIQAQMSPIGVSIQQFGFIGAPRPPQQVIDSINAAQQAKYLAIQKQNEVAQTQADAAKRVAEAEGQAKAAIAVASGQAQANRLLNESLTDKVLERTRLDVQWHMLEKWNGQLPNITTNSGGPQGLLMQINPHQ